MVPHGRQKDQRRMSSLQMVARIKKTEDEKTLNQEFDKSRFDNSWTDPKAKTEQEYDMPGADIVTVRNAFFPM